MKGIRLEAGVQKSIKKIVGKKMNRAQDSSIDEFDRSSDNIRELSKHKHEFA